MFQQMLQVMTPMVLLLGLPMTAVHPSPMALVGQRGKYHGSNQTDGSS
jgi:hypothetical protein